MNTSSNTDDLALLVQEAIDLYFLSCKQKSSFRQTHDALRKLLKMASEAEFLLELIQADIKTLPASALATIETRCHNLWERLFDEPPPADGFVQWSQSVKLLELPKALVNVLCDGEQPVRGRNRPNGKRSQPRLEPSILSSVRGRGATKAGGRPGTPKDDLVLALAHAWLRVTHISPNLSESGHTAFGALVHHVFSWLELETANAALKRLRTNTVPPKAFVPGVWIS